MLELVKTEHPTCVSNPFRLTLPQSRLKSEGGGGSPIRETDSYQPVPLLPSPSSLKRNVNDGTWRLREGHTTRRLVTERTHRRRSRDTSEGFRVYGRNPLEKEKKKK